MSLKRDAYVAKMKTKLDKWNAEINKLESGVVQTGAETSAELHNQVASLQAKRKELKEKIDGLLGSGEDAWRDLRTGVESSWKALDKAGHSAIENFKRFDPSQIRDVGLKTAPAPGNRLPRRPMWPVTHRSVILR